MRLFIAIELSEPIRAAAYELALELRQGADHARLTRPENLHLTLAFLGEVEDPAPVRAALTAACTGGAFSLTVGGLDRFEDLWWAGVRHNRQLETLALGVQTALRQEGFSIERRPWRPHITLVRRWRGPEPHLTVPDTAMQAERVSLMRSDRVEGKLVYTEVSAFRL